MTCFHEEHSVFGCASDRPASDEYASAQNAPDWLSWLAGTATGCFPIRDTADLPEASGEAIAREFERYLKRRETNDD